MPLRRHPRIHLSSRFSLFVVKCHVAAVACLVSRFGVMVGGGYAVVVGMIGWAFEERFAVIVMVVVVVVDKPLLAMLMRPESRAAPEVLVLHDLRVQRHVGVGVQGMHMCYRRCGLRV